LSEDYSDTSALGEEQVKNSTIRIVIACALLKVVASQEQTASWIENPIFEARIATSGELCEKQIESEDPEVACTEILTDTRHLKNNTLITQIEKECQKLGGTSRTRRVLIKDPGIGAELIS
jgi:hypothetical protein